MKPGWQYFIVGCGSVWGWDPEAKQGWWYKRKPNGTIDYDGYIAKSGIRRVEDVINCKAYRPWTAPQSYLMVDDDL